MNMNIEPVASGSSLAKPKASQTSAAALVLRREDGTKHPPKMSCFLSLVRILILCLGALDSNFSRVPAQFHHDMVKTFCPHQFCHCIRGTKGRFFCNPEVLHSTS